MYVARAGQYWLWETAQCSECWAVLVVGHPPPQLSKRNYRQKYISMISVFFNQKMVPLMVVNLQLSE